MKRIGGMSQLAKHLNLWPSALKWLLLRNKNSLQYIYDQVVSSHINTLKSKEIKQIDKIIDFLCCLHLRDKDSLKSGRFKDFDWMFSNSKNGITLSRAWIKAIQKEYKISLIPDQLLDIPKIIDNRRHVIDTIHYIHQATYNILSYKNIEPTYNLIFRNTVNIEKSIYSKYKDHILSADRTLSKFPIYEYDKVKLETFNIRCCSIKPHGCENYDFNFNKSYKFVISRGMDEKSYVETECVMPTILYTLQEKNLRRYKGNADINDVIFIAGDDLMNFFEMYEVDTLKGF
jgi:hypothetical protein